MAYGIKSHKFLCCLPVRLGVFILSFVHFTFYGLLAVLVWVGLGLKNVHFDSREKISVILFAIHCTLFSLIAFLCFYGTIARRLSLVKTYLIVISWMLGFSLVIGILNIIMIFTKNKEDFINDCIDGRTDQDVIDSCHHVNTVRFTLVGIVVVLWLISLYECIIVARYVEQLGEEKAEKLRLKSLRTQTYNTVPGRESTEAFAVQFRDDAEGGLSRGSFMDAKGDVKLYGLGPHETV